jgi:hypothetical protein
VPKSRTRICARKAERWKICRAFQNVPCLSVPCRACPYRATPTIEKSPRLHLMVMKKIEDVVRKALASKVKTTKPKTKKQKSNA